ncbi:MAG: oligosaccharide flippase family protein [Gaiellaceae bacterium]|jgi:O-antigen/teichoic acid export membrane protein
MTARSTQPQINGQHEAGQGTISVAGGSSLLLVSRVLASAGYFVAVFLLARGLSLVERGSVAFITVTALVIAAVSRLGIDDATTVFAAQRHAQRPVLLTNMLAVAVIGSFVFGSAVCSVLLFVPGIRPAGVGAVQLAILLVGSVTASLQSGALAFLLGCGRIRTQAFIGPVFPWLYASLIALAWTIFGLSVTGAVLAWTGSQIFTAVLSIAATLPIAGLGSPNWRLLRTTVRFGIRVWAREIAVFVNARIDQVIMGLIASEASLGIYAVAVNAGETSLYIPGAVAIALIPIIASTAEDKRLDLTLRVARAMFLIGLASIAVGALGGSPLIPIVFGHRYDASIVPFLWLLPGALGFSAIAVFGSALVASGSPGRSSLGPAAALVVGIALDLALIPPYGADGAAAAATVAFLAGGTVSTVLHWRFAGYRLSKLAPRLSDIALIWGLVKRARQRVSSASPLAETRRT